MAGKLLDELRARYLETLKGALLHGYWDYEAPEHALVVWLKRVAPRLFGHSSGSSEDVREGRVWPRYAFTMIGKKRLDNLQYCCETVIKEGIDGDFIETGVWRGGACILMRAILKSYDIGERNVWVADSFQGLPPPDPEKYPFDRSDRHHTYKELRVTVEDVRRNFERFDLLDGQVSFLRGWFKETLPTAPIDKLAVCRLDGDMYESTMDALGALYQRLSPGGFLIVDDYGAVEGCRQAVMDFRARHGIADEIKSIDWAGVYWRKSG